MNSQNLNPSQNSAAEALDRIEQHLLAASTASLDELDDEPPARCVDEFAPEFWMGLTAPPR
jgi:hypothetical protein